MAPDLKGVVAPFAKVKFLFESGARKKFVCFTALSVCLATLAAAAKNAGNQNQDLAALALE